MKYILILLLFVSFANAVKDKDAYNKYTLTKTYKENSVKPTSEYYNVLESGIDKKENITYVDYSLKALENQTGEWAKLGAFAKYFHREFIYISIEIIFLNANNQIVFKSKKVMKKMYFNKENNFRLSISYPKELIFTTIQGRLDIDLKESTYSGDILTEKSQIKESKEEINKKIIEYCKIKANMFHQKSLIDYEYNSCTNRFLSKSISLLEINEMIDTAKEIQKKIQKDFKEIKEKELNKKNTMTLETGDWIIKEYVDKFREKTGNYYITTSKLIKGTFSNTATENSKLIVRLLIDSPSEISMQLYEYAGTNPVKESNYNSYNVYIRDENKKSITHREYSTYSKRYYNITPRAILKNDRITFDKESVKAVHKALLGGGKFKFYIENADRVTSNYTFDIDNTDYYSNALERLNALED